MDYLFPLGAAISVAFIVLESKFKGDELISQSEQDIPSVDVMLQENQAPPELRSGGVYGVQNRLNIRPARTDYLASTDPVYGGVIDTTMFPVTARGRLHVQAPNLTDAMGREIQTYSTGVMPPDRMYGLERTQHRLQSESRKKIGEMQLASTRKHDATEGRILQFGKNGSGAPAVRPKGGYQLRRKQNESSPRVIPKSFLKGSVDRSRPEPSERLGIGRLNEMESRTPVLRSVGSSILNPRGTYNQSLLGGNLRIDADREHTREPEMTRPDKRSARPPVLSEQRKQHMEMPPPRPHSKMSSSRMGRGVDQSIREPGQRESRQVGPEREQNFRGSVTPSFLQEHISDRRQQNRQVQGVNRHTFQPMRNYPNDALATASRSSSHREGSQWVE